jgi:hypothetical protein
MLEDNRLKELVRESYKYIGDRASRKSARGRDLVTAASLTGNGKGQAMGKMSNHHSFLGSLHQ